MSPNGGGAGVPMGALPITRIVGGQDADPYANYLFYHAFSDANGTACSDGAPEKDTVGTGWEETPTSYTIQDGYAEAPNAADRRYLAADVGIANVIIETKVQAISGKNPGTVGRLQDATHCWFVLISADSDDVAIYKDDNGFSRIDGDTTQTITADAWFTIRWEMSGKAHNIYVNDTLTLTVAADSFLDDQTKHGLWNNGASTACRYDYFWAKEI
jgi:hypothetical protein